MTGCQQENPTVQEALTRHLILANSIRRRVYCARSDQSFLTRAEHFPRTFFAFRVGKNDRPQEKIKSWFLSIRKYLCGFAEGHTSATTLDFSFLLFRLCSLPTTYYQKEIVRPMPLVAHADEGPPKQRALSVSEEGLSSMVQVVPRSELESIVHDLAQDETNCSRVRSRLEEAYERQKFERNAKRICIPYANATQLVTRGPFSVLGADLTVAVLKHLPIDDRIDAVSRVCRGWRELAGYSELWRNVEYRSSLRLRPERFTYFVRNFVPPGSVTSLSLRCVGSITRAAELRCILEQCGVALSEVTRLRLVGNKISSSILRCIRQQRFYANLKALVIEDSHRSATLDSLSSFPPSLEVLHADCLAESRSYPRSVSLSEISVLAISLASGRTNRDAAPLLRDLALDNASCPMTATSLFRLGSYFPELERLRIEGVSHLAKPDYSLPLCGPGTEIISRISSAISSAVPFSRLKELKIVAGTHFSPFVDVEATNLFFSAVVSCAPVLEKLELGVISADFDCTQEKPLLRLSGALPCSLRELSIARMSIDESSFVMCEGDVGITSENALTSVRLQSCDKNLFGVLLHMSYKAKYLRHVVVSDFGPSWRCGQGSRPSQGDLFSLSQLAHTCVSLRWISIVGDFKRSCDLGKDEVEIAMTLFANAVAKGGNRCFVDVSRMMNGQFCSLFRNGGGT